MASRGPAPKRSSERRRRNSPATQTVEAQGPRVAMPPASRGWHQIARKWYVSLADSGQSQFYEPSDWERARYIAELVSRSLRSPKVSAGLVSTIMSGMAELLDTEGSRRRVGMEIVRGGKPKLAAVSVMDEYRDALGG